MIEICNIRDLLIQICDQIVMDKNRRTGNTIEKKLILAYCDWRKQGLGTISLRKVRLQYVEEMEGVSLHLRVRGRGHCFPQL